MFGFMMAGSYESRKVGRYDGDNMSVSTASMNDTEHPYETAVMHELYNNGRWIIVEEYDSKNDAQSGHDKWVKVMTDKKLPGALTDVSTAAVAKLDNLLTGEDPEFKQTKPKGE